MLFKVHSFSLSSPLTPGFGNVAVMAGASVVTMRLEVAYALAVC